jgi:acyl-coenzyme A synthetase/AMP-(fatty) acid ligase
MPDTSYRLEKQTTGSCTPPLPKGAENTTRLAMRYARAFSQSFKETQYVVFCGVSAPLAQAITLGAWMAGHPVAFINPSYTKIQLNEVLSQLGTSLKIGTPDCLASLENKQDWLATEPEKAEQNNLADWLKKYANEDAIVSHEWHDEECALVIFTSGSTGMPKGGCHSIGNLTRSTELLIQKYSIDQHDRMLTTAPLNTLCGVRAAILVPLISGCQLIESPKGSQYEDALDVFHRERPTICVSGPILFRQMAMLADKLEDELSSVRILLSFGAKLDRSSRVRLWEKHRVPVLDVYSMTETSVAIGEDIAHYKPELDVIGQPFPGIKVELVEVAGISDPELRLGQIRIYSPNLFLGYLGEPLARKRYFDTGDLGARDAADNFSLKGRLDHGVKATSGLWLFHQAVEQLLVNRSDVADAYVRSEYDQYDRGILRAKVVPVNLETADDGWLATLSQDIEDQLGTDYKAVNIEIASEIKRTALGKIIKEAGQSMNGR